MYCPNCSSNNQAELRFCTHCGTNLAVVSDALSGRTSDQSHLDERMVALFKDYYRGRNSVIIGGIATLIALFKVVLFALLGLPAGTGFLGTLAGILLIYGIIALIWGAGKWNDSASEIKAIQRAASAGGAPRSLEGRHALLSSEPANIRTGSPNTDPLAIGAEYPGSVTEQTTRQLKENVVIPPKENQ